MLVHFFSVFRALSVVKNCAFTTKADSISQSICMTELCLMTYRASSKPFCYIFLLLATNLIFGTRGLVLQLSWNATYQHKMPELTVWVLKNYNLSYDCMSNWIRLVDCCSWSGLSYFFLIYFLYLPALGLLSSLSPCLTALTRHISLQIQYHWVERKPSISFCKSVSPLMLVS